MLTLKLVDVVPSNKPKSDLSSSTITAGAVEKANSPLSSTKKSYLDDYLLKVSSDRIPLVNNRFLFKFIFYYIL